MTEITAKISGENQSFLILSFPYDRKEKVSPFEWRLSKPKQFFIELADIKTHSKINEIDPENIIKLDSLKFASNKQSALRVVWFTMLGIFQSQGCYLDKIEKETSFRNGIAIFNNNVKKPFTINQIRIAFQHIIRIKTKWVQTSIDSQQNFKVVFRLGETIDSSQQWSISQSNTEERITHSNLCGLVYCEHTFEKGELIKFLETKKQNYSNQIGLCPICE